MKIDTLNEGLKCLGITDMTKILRFLNRVIGLSRCRRQFKQPWPCRFPFLERYSVPGWILFVSLLGPMLQAGEKPNVLLILVDDLKPVMGCHVDPLAKTPHMDKLSARGMRFDLAYCNQAVCAPSRFTLML